MKIKTFEKLRFKFSGRSVPAVKMEDIGPEGKVGTIHFLGDVRKRANSLITPWDEKGWEIKAGVGQINYITEDGLRQLAYVVTESGEAVDIFINKSPYPNREDIIGHAATMDDIADSMDLGRSMKNMIIGLCIGAALGVLILGPALQRVMS